MYEAGGVIYNPWT